MKPSLHRSAYFTEDFDLQYLWYLERAGEEVAEKYHAAVVSTIERLLARPDLGRRRSFRHPELRGIHSFCVEAPFSVHLIFYRHIGTEFFAERLIPGMRDLPRRLLEPPGTD